MPLNDSYQEEVVDEIAITGHDDLEEETTTEAVSRLELETKAQRRFASRRFQPGDGPSRGLLHDHDYEPSDGPFSSSTTVQQLVCSIHVTILAKILNTTQT